MSAFRPGAELPWSCRLGVKMLDPRRFLVLSLALIFLLVPDSSCQASARHQQWKIRYVHSGIYDDPGTEFWIGVHDERIIESPTYYPARRSGIS